MAIRTLLANMVLEALTNIIIDVDLGANAVGEAEGCLGPIAYVQRLSQHLAAIAQHVLILQLHPSILCKVSSVRLRS